jgi:3-hydroxymyristoyl/3-hydroxydecanoyl-(acyl carrier protein) dehydratase
VILDCVLRTAEAQLGTAACGWEVATAKFPSPARPGDDLSIQLTRNGAAALRFECLVGERAVAGGVLRRLRGPTGGAPPAT